MKAVSEWDLKTYKKSSVFLVGLHFNPYRCLLNLYSNLSQMVIFANTSKTLFWDVKWALWQRYYSVCWTLSKLTCQSLYS